MKALICARAAVLRALSACPIILGSTNAANSAMMTTTTIISISVTPACRLFLFMAHRPSLLHRNVVHADNRQHDAQDQNADDQSHSKDDQRLKQRCKSPDGGARVGVVDVGHPNEHLIQPPRFFADAQQVRG